LHVDFEQGRIVKADGKVRAGGVEFDAPAWAGAPQPSALQAGAAAASAAGGVLALDYLRGEWRLARRDSGWRVRVEALELAGPAQQSASITATVDAALSGEWVRGKLESASLQSVAAIGRWLAPHLQLAGVERGGQVGLQQLEMQHERARLSINGALSGDLSSWQPSIAARAVLTGADVAFVERLLGEGLGQAFGAGAARLTGGRIESAQFELRGAVGNELL